MTRVTSTILLTCVLPTVASAHGFVLYVATPITPPQDLRWWFPVACAILITGAFLIMWRVFGRHWLTAIGLSLCSVTLFSILFFMSGRFAATASTAPPPGLGFPHPTLWGMGWRRVGWLFVRWNFYGYGFLLCSLFLCGGICRAKARFKKLAVWTSVLYTLGLIPYLASGALVHGWAGSYVRMGCERRLVTLNSALIEYAKEHDGRFPSADKLESILKALEPYFSQDRIRYSLLVAVCPLGGAYERHPKPYEWDSSFSGVSIRDIDPDQFFQEKVPFSCPYHEPMRDRITFMLREQIFDARYSENPNKTDAGDGL